MIKVYYDAAYDERAGKQAIAVVVERNGKRDESLSRVIVYDYLPGELKEDNPEHLAFESALAIALLLRREHPNEEIVICGDYIPHRYKARLTSPNIIVEKVTRSENKAHEDAHNALRSSHVRSLLKKVIIRWLFDLEF